jgi:hypothetical protein
MLKVPAGATFMLSLAQWTSAQIQVLHSSAFVDIDVVSAQADTADVDVEFVVFAV